MALKESFSDARASFLHGISELYTKKRFAPERITASWEAFYKWPSTRQDFSGGSTSVQYSISSSWKKSRLAVLIFTFYT